MGFSSSSSQLKRKRRFRLLPFLLAITVVTCLLGLGFFFVRYTHFRSPTSFVSLSEQTTIPESANIKAEQFYYAYGLLDEQQREEYDIIFDALLSGTKRSFPVADKDEIKRIETHVFADHPELSDFTALVVCEGDVFSPSYVAGVPLITDEQKREILGVQLSQQRDICLSGISSDLDNYGKAKYIYEWLAKNTSYDIEAAYDESDIVINARGYDTYSLEPGSSVPSEHGQTLANALLDKSAVCAGYARAYQYLLQSLGIQCVYISGEALGASHAWCLALLDGDYYFIDPTWADPEYTRNGDQELPENTVDYRFFCVTSEAMAKTHIPDSTFALPICSALRDNYYVREGLYFEEQDDQRFQELVTNASYAGLPLSIRCANEDIYQSIMSSWVENGQIGRYTPLGSYRYSGDELGIFTIDILPA